MIGAPRMDFTRQRACASERGMREANANVPEACLGQSMKREGGGRYEARRQTDWPCQPWAATTHRDRSRPTWWRAWSSRMRSSALRLTHRSWYPSSASSTGAPAFPVTWEERFTPLTAGANSPRHATTKTMWRSILPNYGRPRLLREATPSSFTSFLAFLLFHLLINGCNTRIETRFFTETTYSSSSFCWSFRLGRGHRQRAHHGLPAEHPPLCADHADHHPVLYYRRHRQLGSMGAFNEPRFQPGRPRGRAGEDGGGSGVFFFLVELAALAGSKYGFAGAQALESLFQGLAALGRLAAVLFPCWPRRWQGPCLRADFPPSPFSSAFWVSPQSSPPPYRPAPPFNVVDTARFFLSARRPSSLASHCCATSCFWMTPTTCTTRTTR